MSRIKPDKKRGRPGPGRENLSQELIVRVAREIMFQERKSFSIRGVAARLGADPMAIYHYFENKAALLEAICLGAMDEIYRPKKAKNWRLELKRLVKSYLELLYENPGLLETLLSLAARSQGPGEIFGERFLKAIPGNLSEKQKTTALHLLADYMHGFALGKQFVAQPGELKLYMQGLDAPLEMYLDALEAMASSS